MSYICLRRITFPLYQYCIVLLLLLRRFLSKDTTIYWLNPSIINRPRRGEFSVTSGAQLTRFFTEIDRRYRPEAVKKRATKPGAFEFTIVRNERIYRLVKVNCIPICNVYVCTDIDIHINRLSIYKRVNRYQLQ